MFIFNEEYADREYVMYLSDKKIDNIKSNLDKVRGYIVYYYDDEEDSITVQWFWVNEKHRGCGYGNKLLKNLIDNYKDFIEKIELDDMSDMYRKDNNIYVKNGFRYTDSFGPEMELIF
jgi:ribosomal protein S18 acetylase RimI-like enzyme